MSAGRHHITVRCPAAFRRPGRIRLVRRAAQAAIAQARIDEPLALSIVLADDAALRDLNRRFRGLDQPTDVLSFGGQDFYEGRPRSLRRAQPVIEQDGPRYIGDIAISMERCAEQAARGGHDIDAELALLVAHGALHLLGYDHDTPARKSRMWRAQAAALAALGLVVTPLET